MRRIGMLMAYAASDPEAQLFVRTFVQGLSEFGWNDGKNLQIDSDDELNSHGFSMTGHPHGYVVARVGFRKRND